MRKFNIVITDELTVVKTFYAENLEEAKNKADADYNNMMVDVLAKNGYDEIGNKEYELNVEFTKEYALDEIDETYGNFWDAVVSLEKMLDDWVPESVANIFGKGGQLRKELMTLQSNLSKLQQKIEDYEKNKEVA